MPSKSSILHALELLAANGEAYDSSEPGPISRRPIAIVYREIQFLITVLEHEAEGHRHYRSSLVPSTSALIVFSIDYERSPFLLQPLPIRSRPIQSDEGG
jgi:hypothetical protein